jgi:hypothetical protein
MSSLGAASAEAAHMRMVAIKSHGCNHVANAPAKPAEPADYHRRGTSLKTHLPLEDTLRVRRQRARRRHHGLDRHGVLYVAPPACMLMHLHNTCQA